MNLFYFILLFVISLFSSNAWSQSLIERFNVDDIEWLYAQGTNVYYNPYDYNGRQRINLSVGAGWSTGNMCAFNPQAHFKEQFDKVVDQAERAGEALLASIAPLATSFVLREIRDLNPALYDLIQGYTIKAQQDLNLAIKSCQGFQSDIADGSSPLDGWIKVGKRDLYRDILDQGKSPTDAEEPEELENKLNEGIVGVNGELAGGLSNPPIKITEDLIRQGYTTLQSQQSTPPADRQSTPPADSNDELTFNYQPLFNSEESAIAWGRQYLGEKQIRVCEGCDKYNTDIGTGLKGSHQEELEWVKDKFDDIFNDSGTPTQAQLLELSVPAMGFYFRPAYLNQLRRENNYERTILAGKLIDEIAIARTLAKATEVRDILRAGIDSPHVQSNGVLLEESQKLYQKLQDEFDEVLYQQQIRSSVSNRASSLLLARRK